MEWSLVVSFKFYVVECCFSSAKEPQHDPKGAAISLEATEETVISENLEDLSEQARASDSDTKVPEKLLYDPTSWS